MRMLKELIMPKKKKKKIRKESVKKVVPTERFNEMIEYYTRELKARFDEIKKLKEQNQLLTQTALKSSNKSDQSYKTILKLQEENRILRGKVNEHK